LDRGDEIVILSCDPGETTGVFVGKFTAGDDKPEVLRVGETDLWAGLERLFMEYFPDVCVYETFKLYPWMARTKSWSTFPTVEVIGVLKYLANRYAVPIVGQGANMKKSTRINPKHPSPHVRDAARHALVYWRRHSK